MIKIKELERSLFNKIINFNSRNKILNHYFIQPLRAGLIGFTLILVIMVFLDLLTNIFGEHNQLDRYDFIIAGLGFLLQVSETILRGFFN